MSRRKADYPIKRSMNLYYKPDRTTKPATAALYILFALTCLLGLAKVMVYDLWAETRDAERVLTFEQTRLEGVMAELADYEQVIGEDGTIYQPLETRTVKGFYEITAADGSVAKTEDFTLTVPGQYKQRTV